MSITSKDRIDKVCFVYCGKDKCNCKAGAALEVKTGQASENTYHSDINEYPRGYDVGYKAGFYDGFKKAVETMNIKTPPTPPPFTIPQKEWDNVFGCNVCKRSNSDPNVAMGVVCNIPNCPRNAY